MAENFSEKAQLAKYASLWGKGPFLNNPITPPKMTFVQGWTAEVLAKLRSTGIKKGA